MIRDWDVSSTIWKTSSWKNPCCVLLQNSWNIKKHVFRFNWFQMCPMVEEFGVITGKKKWGTSYSWFTTLILKKILCKYLSHPLQDMEEVVDKDFIFDLELLIVLYWKYHYLSDTCLGSMRVVILTAFFFVSDLAPMILAETLMGLDKVAKGETQDFKGSLLLLQVSL